MKVTPYTSVTLEDVTVDGAKRTKIRWLISEKDGAPNFAMRMFEVEPGGFTPYHQHPYEHEVYILEGTGVFVTEEEELPFEPGHVLYADPDMMHQFRNTGSTLVRFLCLIPHQAPAKPEKKAVNPFAAGKANTC